MKQTTLPTLSVGDAVVIRLDNGTEQSAKVIDFSRKNESHVYAVFAWRTGPRTSNSLLLHSCKWADRVLAVFPAGCKFLAV